MQICNKCVLPETFPGISFNQDGICNFCLDYIKPDIQQQLKDEYRQRFEAIVKQSRGTGTYDVLMCYSGGKDSTYTLSILKQKYGLKVLAVSFDNGFISDQTTVNIRNVVENLGVDHIFFKPRFDILAGIFRHCASNNIYPAKAMERASAICTSCMGILKYSMMRFAIERGIPLVAFGWSPGQAPITSSVMKNNPLMVKTMQDSLLKPLSTVSGKDLEPYFLTEKHFTGSYVFPYFVHPLAFLDYQIDQIIRTITSFGWTPPTDVGATSTNCLLDSFANFVHQQSFGFHPYASEMANLVRDGYLDRETALKKLNPEEDRKIIGVVAEKLGVKNPQ